MKKSQEIPQLKVLGLYAAKTLGDGEKPPIVLFPQKGEERQMREY